MNDEPICDGVTKTETKTIKPKKKWVDKKVIIFTAVIAVVFMVGVVVGMFITYSNNCAEPYVKGQQSILTKYACFEKPGYTVAQCTLPECQGLSNLSVK